MAELDTQRVRRYLLTLRENTEDIRALLAEHTDEQILADRYLLKALKYCLIESAEAMADTLQHYLARKKGMAAESYLQLIDKSAQVAVMEPELLGRLKFFFKFRNMLAGAPLRGIEGSMAHPRGKSRACSARGRKKPSGWAASYARSSARPTSTPWSPGEPTSSASPSTAKSSWSSKATSTGSATKSPELSSNQEGASSFCSAV
jgi:uncharacterized protein YutE (UPF0331/DUF86 family)